jgi:perosamine synthetase
MFSILVDENIFGMTRDDLMKKLEEQDIETRPFFPPVHQQPIYQTGQKLPVSEHLSEQGLNLPSSVMVPPEQIDWICRCIGNALE